MPAVRRSAGSGVVGGRLQGGVVSARSGGGGTGPAGGSARAPWCRTGRSAEAGTARHRAAPVRARGRRRRCDRQGQWPRVRSLARRSASSLPAVPDGVLAAAVEQARAAAGGDGRRPRRSSASTSGIEPEIAVPRPTRCGRRRSAPSATHTFASRLPGYVGWHWAVTVAARARRRRRSPSTRSSCCPATRRCWRRPGCRGTSGCARATSPSATCCPPPRTTRGWCRPTPPTTTPPTTRRAASSPSSSGLGRERVMSPRGPRRRGRPAGPTASSGPRSADGPLGARPVRHLRLLAAAGRLAAAAARRLRQRLRPGRRPRRHRRLRLRRAQPGDAGGRRRQPRWCTSARYDTGDFDVLSD